MLREFLLIFLIVCVPWSECAVVPKAHVIIFGKWMHKNYSAILLLAKNL